MFGLRNRLRDLRDRLATWYLRSKTRFHDEIINSYNCEFCGGYGGGVYDDEPICPECGRRER